MWHVIDRCYSLTALCGLQDCRTLHIYIFNPLWGHKARILFHQTQLFSLLVVLTVRPSLSLALLLSLITSSRPMLLCYNWRLCLTGYNYHPECRLVLFSMLHVACSTVVDCSWYENVLFLRIQDRWQSCVNAFYLQITQHRTKWVDMGVASYFCHPDHPTFWTHGHPTQCSRDGIMLAVVQKTTFFS